MKIIVSWSHINAATYAVFRGWPRHAVKIVTEPEHLRGLGRGTQIFFLGPRDLYKYGYYREFLDYLIYLEQVDRVKLTFDDTDNWK